MKKIIFSLIIFGLFQLSYSQKKELKTIDKDIKAQEYESAGLEEGTANTGEPQIQPADMAAKHL